MVHELRKDLLREVQSGHIALCDDCGLPFAQKEPYQKLCPICFKLSCGYEILAGDKAFLWAQVKLSEALKMVAAQVKAASAVKIEPSGLLDPKLLRDLIFLCHPDRHDNSEVATRATQELLKLRSGTQPSREKTRH